MADKVMIDVTMVLHRDSLYQLRGLANENLVGELVISDAFVRMIEASYEREIFDDAYFSILSRFFQIPEEVIDKAAVRDFLQSEAFARNIARYSRTLSYEHEVYQNLIKQTGNEWITQIVFEEWEFLTTNSWLFAKLRAVYDMMVEAGATAIQVSKEAFENAFKKLKEKYQATKEDINELLEKIRDTLNDLSEQAKRDIDSLIRLTLKKKYGDEISPNDRVRALAKWVAVGGASAAGVAPLAIFAANAFLLCDP